MKKDIVRREIMNNPSIRSVVLESTAKAIAPLVPTSSRYNAVYNLDDFNYGMLRGFLRNTSVGGCANAERTASKLSKKKSRRVPTDEWFRVRLAEMDTEMVKGMFIQEILDDLRALSDKGRLPPDGLVVSIDLHFKPRYDRTHGPELTISRYKDGTKYFERYITMQCVNDGCRLQLGCLPVSHLDSVPDMVRALLDQCEECGIKIKMCMFDR